LKVAEDEDGIILRLFETEGIDTMVTITVPFIQIREAYLTNLVEENEKPLSYQRDKVTASIKAFGISAVGVNPDSYTAASPNGGIWPFSFGDWSNSSTGDPK